MLIDTAETRAPAKSSSTSKTPATVRARRRGIPEDRGARAPCSQNRTGLVPAASLGVTLDHRVDRGVHVGDLGHRCRVREQCRALHKDGNRQI